jgi:hypothetical protein
MRVAILADIHEMLRQLSREIRKCAAIIALRRCQQPKWCVSGG